MRMLKTILSKVQNEVKNTVKKASIYICHHGTNGRNMNVKHVSDEVSDGSEDYWKL